MKKPSVFLTGKMPVSELHKLNHACAWEGCKATTPMRAELPRDWRWLLLYWDVTDGPPNPFRGGVKLDRDAVLCPDHWRKLDGLLKDIGQRLRETEGSA